MSGALGPEPGDWVELIDSPPPRSFIDTGCYVVGRTQGGQWVLENQDQQLLRIADSDFQAQWKLSKS